jgi:hypothetical protein
MLGWFHVYIHRISVSDRGCPSTNGHGRLPCSVTCRLRSIDAGQVSDHQLPVATDGLPAELLLPSSGYLLASYCHAPILKTLSGSIFFLRARSRFMVS